MPTQKQCCNCHALIGVASKICRLCKTLQPYKTKLEEAKKKFSNEWKQNQLKNKSLNKLYDSTNLLLHKWNQMERFPVLLLAKRQKNNFVAECLCPRNMGSEEEQDALYTIKQIFENLLKVTIPSEPLAPQPAVLQSNAPIQPAIQPPTLQSPAPALSAVQPSALQPSDLQPPAPEFPANTHPAPQPLAPASSVLQQPALQPQAVQPPVFALPALLLRTPAASALQPQTPPLSPVQHQIPTLSVLQLQPPAPSVPQPPQLQPPAPSVPQPPQLQPPAPSVPQPPQLQPPAPSVPQPPQLQPPAPSVPQPPQLQPPAPSVPQPPQLQPPAPSVPQPPQLQPPAPSVPQPSQLQPPAPSVPQSPALQLPEALQPPTQVLTGFTDAMEPVLIPKESKDFRRCKKSKRKTENGPVHLHAETFPYERILRRRIREGNMEVLVRWKQCCGCGLAWKDTWEPADVIEQGN